MQPVFLFLFRDFFFCLIMFVFLINSPLSRSVKKKHYSSFNQLTPDSFSQKTPDIFLANFFFVCFFFCVFFCFAYQQVKKKRKKPFNKEKDHSTPKKKKERKQVDKKNGIQSSAAFVPLFDQVAFNWRQRQTSFFSLSLSLFFLFFYWGFKD